MSSLSAPAHALRKGLAQPLLGLAGLLFVVLAVVTLGLFPSRPEALTVTITIITFGLPFVIAVVLWWEGRPFRTTSRGVNGWGRFGFLIVMTLAFAAIGQLVTGQLDIAGMFGAEGGFSLFPYGFVLAATIFVTMLQITFVWQKMPLHRLHPVAGGLVALALSWVIGVALYFVLLNWNGGPGTPPVPPVAGNGPIYGLDFPAILLSIVVLQMLFFVTLKGHPFTGIKNATARFLAVNVFTIGGGIVLYLVLIAAGISPDLISSIVASITGAVMLLEILFQGWPTNRLAGNAGRFASFGLTLVLAAVICVVLYTLGGIAYPTGPGVPPVDFWIAGVGLNLIATFAIVHAAVFEQWPYRVRQEQAQAPDASADLEPRMQQAN